MHLELLLSWDIKFIYLIVVEFFVVFRNMHGGYTQFKQKLKGNLFTII